MLYVNPLETTHGARAEAALQGGAREKTALRELEHYFLKTLLTEMRATETKGALFGDTPGSRFYQDLLNDKLAGLMAESGQVGVARQIEAQMRIAEAAKKTPPAGVHTQGIALAPEPPSAIPWARAANPGFIPHKPRESREFDMMPISNAGPVTPAGDTP
jgi:Rod binding domain-containing protein